MAIMTGVNPDDVIELVAGQWETWKDARREKEDIWKECLTNYLVYIDESRFENWPWRCKVADTFSQETADVIGSSLRNALFPTNEDFYEIVGDDDRGKVNARKFQDYFDGLLHKMKFIERMNGWCKQLAILGNAPLLASWETLELSRRRRVSMIDATGKRSYQVKDERKKSYDGPGVTVLDAFDVVFNPTLVDRRNSPFIRRTKLPIDQIAKLYKDVDLATLEEEDDKAPSEPSDTMKVQRARIFGVTDQTAIPTNQDEDGIEVLEYRGDLVLEHERYADVFAVVLNRKILAHCERNVYWGGRNLVWGTYDDLWFTPFGKGPLEPVRGTQQLIDTFSCQKADVLNLITNGCFAYVDDGVIDPETLYLRPRAGIEVGNIANIKELHPNANISLTYQEIEFLRARGERSTGKSRFDMGQAPGGRRTAYEASLIRQGGGSRDIDVVKHLANDVLEYVLEWMMVSVQQFKWDSGDLDNEVLLGDYHVNYLGADLTALRQFETQQLMLFLDMMGRYPPFAEAVNAPVLIQEAARLFHFRDKNVVKDPMQYAKEQEEKKRLQAMQMQQAAHGPAAAQPGPQPVDEQQAAELAGAVA